VIGDELVFDGLRFVLTCEVCPEQYDVFDAAGTQVAYVRLRYGKLRVDVPDCGGKVVYFVRWDNDRLKGGFDDDAERDDFLADIADTLTNPEIDLDGDFTIPAR
jgi:hypothetical protein